MKIAIHHRECSFSDRWIAYCIKNSIDYKLVNCYESNIIHQIRDCDILMWHHSHVDYRDALFAKQLLYAVEQGGKKTFPDYNTCWHFDDKVGQKYLFEAIEAPYIPSYVFYNKKDAMDWVVKTNFPKVFKLRRGAGSANVKLVKTAEQALSLINKAFGKGFSQFDRTGYFQNRFNKYRSGKDSLFGVLKGFGRMILNTQFSRQFGYEKGYIYFQDFIPDNLFDIRVIVISGKAFAIKRMVRKDDFRASGSGNIVYEKEHFQVDTIKLAFELTDKIQSQCAAFDFIYDSSGKPLVVELSYGFVIDGYDPCVGYWDKSLLFHEGSFVPQDWMIESLL